MAVTLKDVALLAGVSPSTVSRTCKDHPSISDDTKEKVRRAMAELGYEPNPSNVCTPSQNIKTIGIIMPPSQKEVYENSFYLEMIRGISSFCNQKQYTTIIVTGKDEEELFTSIQAIVQREAVDGFILLYSKINDAVSNYLYNEGLLYVLIGKAEQYANQTIYIDNDNLLAGKEACEYLIDMGHRDIAYIGKPFNLLFSADRKAGYQLALVSHNIPVNPDYCIEVTENPAKRLETMQEFLTRPNRPSAIIVSDDILALTLEFVCMNLGISIPEDLSIVSFNNSLVARLTSPALTSVDTHSFQLGIEAASQIINHIENPNLMATKIIVPHTLVERNSCKSLLTE
ncbi:MAG: LacI family DNA-binding transcriptional regulator [Ruminococcus sp.]|nr:LacI family DNA-binding transcriptional regulator [Ruminococcus sp.]